jgi:hypothetical protein
MAISPWTAAQDWAEVFGGVSGICRLLLNKCTTNAKTIPAAIHLHRIFLDKERHAVGLGDNLVNDLWWHYYATEQLLNHGLRNLLRESVQRKAREIRMATQLDLIVRSRRYQNEDWGLNDRVNALLK